MLQGAGVHHSRAEQTGYAVQGRQCDNVFMVQKRMLLTAMKKGLLFSGGVRVLV